MASVVELAKPVEDCGLFWDYEICDTPLYKGYSYRRLDHNFKEAQTSA